jgi:hypothetical protein
MATWRNASTTTVVTGATLFQRAWTNASGVIQSFDGSSGDNEIEKYWKASTVEVLYRKIEPPLAFFVGTTSSFKWDGTTLTEVAHSTLDASYQAAVMFRNEYYVINSTYTLYKSANLASWSNTSESGRTLATDGTYLVMTYTYGSTIRYTSDGTNWSSYSSFSPGVTVNAVRYIASTGLWVAVGYWDDLMGSGNYKPWCATASAPNGTWTQYAMTGGDGDTAIHDVSYASGSYTFFCYVGNNAGSVNWYNCDPGYLTYQYPDGFTTATGTYNKDRDLGTYVATPNKKILSSIGGNYWLSNGSSEVAAIYQCFNPAQDRNGNAYVIDFTFDSATEYFHVKDHFENIIVTLPGPAYICGGAT